MWGIIPAAGKGRRIQPPAFSKELLPVGSRQDGTMERPRSVMEYPVDRMIGSGVDKLCFMLFTVANPDYFDKVFTDDEGRVTQIAVKRKVPERSLTWGSLSMPCRILHELHELRLRPERHYEYLRTLVNVNRARGGTAFGIRGGTAYADAGTVNGCREAVMLLSGQTGTTAGSSDGVKIHHESTGFKSPASCGV